VLKGIKKWLETKKEFGDEIEEDEIEGFIAKIDKVLQV